MSDEKPVLRVEFHFDHAPTLAVSNPHSIYGAPITRSELIKAREAGMELPLMEGEDPAQTYIVALYQVCWMKVVA